MNPANGISGTGHFWPLPLPPSSMYWLALTQEPAPTPSEIAAEQARAVAEFLRQD